MLDRETTPESADQADLLDREWITPSEAVAALAKVYGNRAVAKDALADLLLDGQLKARAERSWFSDEEYLVHAWRDRENVNPDENVELTQRDWMDSEDWFNDLNRWRWPQARFVLTHVESPRQWRFLTGVTLAVKDVSKAIDLAVRAVSTSKGGPNPDVARWARFWMAAVQLAQEDKLVRTRLQSKGQLYNELKERDPTTFSRRAVDSWIDMLWDRFVESS